jgi:hypothetical protein
VVLEAPLLDELLRHGVAGCEEHLGKVKSTKSDFWITLLLLFVEGLVIPSIPVWSRFA